MAFFFIFNEYSLTFKAEIKKQFQKVDCKDNELAGIQKRYDDETKRRAVKRCAPVTLFKVCAFFVCVFSSFFVIHTYRELMCLLHLTMMKEKSIMPSKLMEPPSLKVSSKQLRYVGSYLHNYYLNFVLFSLILITQVLITTQKTASDSSSAFSGDIAKAQNLSLPIVKLECLIAALNDEGISFFLRLFMFFLFFSPK